MSTSSPATSSSVPSQPSISTFFPASTSKFPFKFFNFKLSWARKIPPPAYALSSWTFLPRISILSDCTVPAEVKVTVRAPDNQKLYTFTCNITMRMCRHISQSPLVHSYIARFRLQIHRLAQNRIRNFYRIQLNITIIWGNINCRGFEWWNWSFSIFGANFYLWVDGDLALDAVTNCMDVNFWAAEQKI